MILNPIFSEVRARDALAFDPLPASAWIKVTSKDIRIAVLYSEALSTYLRKLQICTWVPEQRCWIVKFRDADALRPAIGEINRLAALAKERADAETLKRESERRAMLERRAEEERAGERKRQMSVPRPLRREFMMITPDRPRFALTIEAIGDDTAKGLRFAGFRPRNWVAQLFGCNGRGGWARAFLAGARDYRASNSIGSRGIMVTYLLEEGPIYEISAPKSWKQTDRYFARIAAGKLDRMTRDEVTACLEK